MPLHTASPALPSPPDEELGLGRLGELIATAQQPSPELMETARRLTLMAGGARIAPGTFCAALLDLADRVGRVPPATWLSLCRGLALGASLPGQGSLPLPLRHAAQRLLATLNLPAARRLAMAEALMIGPL